MSFRFSGAILQQAKAYAQDRMDQSKELKNAYGLRIVSEAHDFHIQLIGILGEWTVANELGMSYVYTVNTFKAPDIFLEDGTGVQVKASIHANSLVIRPNAKDEELYVLVKVNITNDYAKGVVVGGIYPWQARLYAEEYPSLWQDPGNRQNPAIFIPYFYLERLEVLAKPHRESVFVV